MDYSQPDPTAFQRLLEAIAQLGSDCEPVSAGPTFLPLCERPDGIVSGRFLERVESVHP